MGGSAQGKEPQDRHAPRHDQPPHLWRHGREQAVALAQGQAEGADRHGQQGAGENIARPVCPQIHPRQGNGRSRDGTQQQPGQAHANWLAAPGQHRQRKEERKRARGVTAGHAEAGQRVDEDFWSATGKEQLAPGIDQRGAQQCGADKDPLAPLPCQEQQAGQHGAGDEHLLELAQLGDHHHRLVHGRAAVFLDQRHQALVEMVQVGVADKHRNQQRQAGATHPQCGAAVAAQGAIEGDAEQHGQAGGNHPGLGPEPFGQWQAKRRASSPAWQQIGYRPAGGGQHADGGKAREGHVAHPGDHGQHRTQWANEASYQQTDDAVLLKVGLSPVHPLGMMTQAWQAADVLVEMSAQVVGNPIAQQPSEQAQQQGFAQRKRAAAGQRGNGEQQYRPRHDNPGDGQAFHKSDDKHRRRQPLRVKGQPAGNAIEPWAHKITPSMNRYLECASQNTGAPCRRCVADAISSRNGCFKYSNQNVIAAFDLASSQRVPCAIGREASIHKAIHQVFIAPAGNAQAGGLDNLRGHQTHILDVEPLRVEAFGVPHRYLQTQGLAQQGLPGAEPLGRARPAAGVGIVQEHLRQACRP